MTEQMPEQLVCGKGLKVSERPYLTHTTSKQSQKGTVYVPDSGRKTAVGISLESYVRNYATDNFHI